MLRPKVGDVPVSYTEQCGGVYSWQCPGPEMFRAEFGPPSQRVLGTELGGLVCKATFQALFCFH